jgi:drug/metabolite transporter (DMT)-like permease
MAVAGILVFVASALQQAGMISTTAGNAGFITSLYVILVPVFLFLGWNERTHWILWLAVILAAFGAYLLSTGGKFETRNGDWLELAGAVLWTGHVVLLGKAATRFDFLSFAIGQFTIAGLLNSGMGLWYESLSVLTSLNLQIAILYTAILSIAVGYTLQIWAQRHTPPTDAALILCLEAVSAVIVGWMVLGESLTLLQITGCLIILLAVFLAQVRTFGFR